MSEIVSERQVALQAVDAILSKLLSAEDLLDRGWAEFGVRLAEIRLKKFWQPEFESFNAYLNTLKDKCRRGRSQLYAYSTVAEKLLEQGVTPEQLNDIGITKAEQLKRAVEVSGRPLSGHVLSEASRPEVSVADLRKILFDEKMIGPEPPSPQMKWFELAFYASVEEIAEFEEMFEVAQRVAEIQGDIKSPQVLKRCLEHIAADFLSTWRQTEVSDDLE